MPGGCSLPMPWPSSALSRAAEILSTLTTSPAQLRLTGHFLYDFQRVCLTIEASMYVVNLLRLVLARRIHPRTAWRALQERPIAVAGRGGSYVVDPDFD